MPPKAQLKGQPPTSEPSLKIFGSFFIPEMRTMCALLELNEITFQQDTIDILSKEGRAEYLGFNPSDMMPTIIEGYKTVVGDPPTLYKYICKTR